MKKNYDFSKSKPNPYAKRLKQQVTILLDKEVVAFQDDGSGLWRAVPSPN